jgi:hypothetical protein
LEEQPELLVQLEGPLLAQVQVAQAVLPLEAELHHLQTE